jgi:hypothetical protein
LVFPKESFQSAEAVRPERACRQTFPEDWLVFPLALPRQIFPRTARQRAALVAQWNYQCVNEFARPASVQRAIFLQERALLNRILLICHWA